jgi:hypothetical protein
MLRMSYRNYSAAPTQSIRTERLNSYPKDFTYCRPYLLISLSSPNCPPTGRPYVLEDGLFPKQLNEQIYEKQKVGRLFPKITYLF